LNAAETSYEQPGRRRPAPGRLGLVQSFVNTRDIEAGTDALAGSDDLTRWLRDAGLGRRGTRANHADVGAAIELREALRSLLLANNGGRSQPRAWNVLNATSASARVKLVFGAKTHKPALEPEANGVRGALGLLVAIVAAAMEDQTWYRLKACRRDVCRWAFYDHSPAQASVWCAMSICGNRTKIRRHRQRHRDRRINGRRT
jgi:predicted RNA-binding Zn ribbon-like protein